MSTTNEYIRYLEVLVLDNFVRVLSTGERIMVNQYRAGRTDQVPEKAQRLRQWLDTHSWDIPTLYYSSEDGELKYREKGIEKQLKENELYNKKII
ncbi:MULTISPECIES: hypothetical protein [Capnocytophaga]|uniref:hypothetical protein n=1 Tax=Capnocytophaga TaxID=1016 RepID=UPI000BB1AF5D|nr:MULTISPECIES: hypothetical protein [Capnocytophaga]ATA75251.1 hypothetical protein CGC52_07390 [Capnocytophaga sp. H2931]